MRTTNPIAALFGKSPIRPMQKHMGTVAQCAGRLEPLIRALADSDWEEANRLREEIFALESEADVLKNEIRAHLPKSMMLPVDRRDLLDLLGSQDDIANVAQDVAGLMAMRRMVIPGALRERFDEFTSRVLAAVFQCRDVINELDELLATSFRGRSADKVLEMVDVLAGIETETDTLEFRLTAGLFEMEGDLEPLTVVFLHELFRLVGQIADHSESVGDRIRLLIAR